MASTPRVRDIPAEPAVVALVAAASVPLTRLFRAGLGGVVFVSIALSMLVSWGARRLRLPAALGWFLSLVALLWFLSVRFFPSTLAGIFPSGHTLHAIGVAVRDGARHIYNDAPPVDPLPSIMLYVAAGVWLTTWLVDASAISLENPLLATGSALPLFLIAGSLTRSRRLWLDAGLFLIASAMLVYVKEQRRVRSFGNRGVRAGWKWWHALAIATIAATICVTLAPSVPGYGKRPVLTGRGAGPVTFNPFVAIRPTLNSRNEVLLFVVRETQPTYHRLATVEYFDGDRFSHRAFGEQTTAFGTEEPPAPTATVEATYQIESLGGPWIPAPFEPVAFSGPDGTTMETGTGTLLTPGGSKRGTRYSVTSSVPSPTPDILDVAVSYDDGTLRPYLQLPKNEGTRLRPLAEQIVGDAANPFEKAVRLQNYLRSFTYDEKVAAHHSFSDILDFLTRVKRGYCEQFAASMAVLARTLGIPSRIAIGFAPGQFDTRTRSYVVSTRFAHSWVEIYFPQSGWVAFEPTPRAHVALPPSYTLPRAPGSSQSTPFPNLTPTPSRRASPSALPSPRRSDEATETPAVSPAGWVWWLALPVAVVMLPMLFLLGLGLRRRTRFARARTPRDGITLHYVDFLEWCAAAGHPRAPGETPAELSSRLGASFPTAAEPLAALGLMVEKALWAPPNGNSTEAAARAASEARRAIGDTLSRKRRLRALFRFGRRA
ncbi:MAG: DUF3488 and DUF4129 domain-containing transglutaminase family protein [Actinomycetota bacterium]